MLARRLLVAPDEKCLLPGFGGWHGAWRSIHDCCAVRYRSSDDSGDCGCSLFSTAEYFSTQRCSHQFCRCAYTSHCPSSEYFHHSHFGRRAFPYHDGLGSRPPITASGLRPASNCNDCVVSNLVLWN